MSLLQLVEGETFHGRHGAIRNDFRYRMDYVLIDPDDPGPEPRLFSRNARNLVALHDRDIGGQPGQGGGAAWVRQVLAAHGLERAGARLWLLTVPRVAGVFFNPVSFWFCHDDQGQFLAAVAEVSNTFGNRHWYLCHHDDLRPILPTDRLGAQKIMHVSPFQPIAGGYSFRFHLSETRLGVWIDYRHEGGGLFATFTGTRTRLSDAAILRSALRRPVGAIRVLALIHWQALRLFVKRARYRDCPPPPEVEVSR